MTITTYPEIEQGTDDWHDQRRGIPTASVIGQLITAGAPPASAVGCPTCQADPGDPCLSLARKVPAPIKTFHDDRAFAASVLPPVYRVADNDTSRALTLRLAAERITGFTEEMPTSRDVERGHMDEPYAREAYSVNYAEVTETGFMVRDDWGYKIGYSPDGLVRDDGLIEIKSRLQKNHLQTILADEVPAGNMAQLQTGLLVSGRAWCDYVSFCSGMPLWTKRVEPDEQWFKAILDSTKALEESIASIIERYEVAVVGRPPTERIEHFSEIVF